jgi:hypothetical protein
LAAIGGPIPRESRVHFRACEFKQHASWFKGFGFLRLLFIMDDSRQPLLSDREEEEEEREISSPHGRDGSYRRPMFVQPGKFTSLEKLLFFVSSVMLILLSVFAGLYARSAMEGKPPVNDPPKSDPPTETPPADEVS